MSNFSYNHSTISRQNSSATEDTVAKPAATLYERKETGEKVASADPVTPDFGPEVEESPRLKKLRRLGELLKKVEPTRTTGHPTPTPPRGTP